MCNRIITSPKLCLGSAVHTTFVVFANKLAVASVPRVPVFPAYLAEAEFARVFEREGLFVNWCASAMRGLIWPRAAVRRARLAVAVLPRVARVSTVFVHEDASFTVDVCFRKVGVDVGAEVNSAA